MSENDVTAVAWSKPAPPHVLRVRVGPDDIDMYGHVNNVRYVAWAMDCAWSHSHALGLTFGDYERQACGFVVKAHAFDYLAAALPDDEELVATWIVANDRRLRLTRAFELVRAGDLRRLVIGRTDLVTIDLASGRPRRMPEIFAATYAPTVEAS